MVQPFPLEYPSQFSGIGSRATYGPWGRSIGNDGRIVRCDVVSSALLGAALSGDGPVWSLWGRDLWPWVASRIGRTGNGPLLVRLYRSVTGPQIASCRVTHPFLPTSVRWRLFAKSMIAPTAMRPPSATEKRLTTTIAPVSQRLRARIPAKTLIVNVHRGKVNE